MQIRFLHDPSKDTGFVGCALTSNMVRFFKNQDGSWSHEVCINISIRSCVCALLLWACACMFFLKYHFLVLRSLIFFSSGVNISESIEGAELDYS